MKLEKTIINTSKSLHPNITNNIKDGFICNVTSNNHLTHNANRIVICSFIIKENKYA